MNVQANNNNGAAGGNCKYPNDLGYVAEQEIDHFDRHEFRKVPVDMIYRYNQRHAALATSDFTAYAYAMMTPVDELLEIMQQVDRANRSPSLFATSKLGSLLVCNLHPLKKCMKTTDFQLMEDLIYKQPFCLCPAGVCWQY